jgi:hypothetical protein
MKRISMSVLGVIVLQLISTASAQAEDAKPTARAVVNISTFENFAENSDAPNAVVLSVHGKCTYSEDGVNFYELTSKHVLTQGAVVRTGEKSRIDIFFRRIGTTVRLQADTEVKLEKMSRSTKDGLSVLETLLDLRQGRIFTVVRSLVEGSTFEIRNAAGRSVVEGAPAGSMGRYIITADGTEVADKSSLLPLKLIGETGITIIHPGQKFDRKEGKMLAVATPEAVLMLIEFDELHALLETDTPPTATKLKR